MTEKLIATDDPIGRILALRNTPKHDLAHQIIQSIYAVRLFVAADATREASETEETIKGLLEEGGWGSEEELEAWIGEHYPELRDPSREDSLG